MHIYIYVSIQTSLVRFQRQAVVKDRPDGYVEEYLVAAEDKHHLEEHDGRRPEQAPAETRPTLASESIYAEALYGDPSATLGDVREAVTMLEELVPTARRVFGGAHPTTVGLGAELKLSRAALRARETPPTSG